MLLEVRQEAKRHLLVGTVILGFLSIFTKSRVSPPFEALNSARLSRCQRELRPPVQKRRRPRAFFTVSTWDSDNPSSCQMKEEPAFKPLQGNPAFFLVRASQGAFHWGRKHRIPLTYPLLKEGYSWGFCGKLVYLFNRILGIHWILEMIWRPWSLPRIPVLKLVFL